MATAAAGAAMEKLPKVPYWGAAGIAAATFLSALLLDHVKGRASDWIDLPVRRRAALEAQLRMRDRRGRVQRVRACRDALRLGVHRAATADAGEAMPDLPPYVRRDAHAHLRGAFADGGPVVIEGPSAAGKSRLAFETMHAFAAERWLIVPETLDSLRGLRDAGVPLADAVVWLDDVERYLTSGGLDAGVLDALCPENQRNVIVLATLRVEARRLLAAPDLDPGVKDAAADFFRRARVVRLERDLSAAERRRAQLRCHDPRIVAALGGTGYAGFAERIAAAPAALHRWNSARQGEQVTAGAIITAAIAARRAGHTSPIPRGLLEELHHAYLPPRDLGRTDRPGFGESLAWAAQPVKGASGCLNPVGDDLYEPFDHLLDHARRVSPTPDIPLPVWETVLRHAPHTDLVSIGQRAGHAGWPCAARAALSRAAQGDGRRPAGMIGGISARAGRGAATGRRPPYVAGPAGRGEEDPARGDA